MQALGIDFNAIMSGKGLMTSSETPEAEGPESEDDTHWPKKSYWRPVSRELWKRSKGPSGLAGLVSSWANRAEGVFSSAAFLVFVIAPVGGLGAYLTFYLALDLGGTVFFGAYFIGIWTAIIICSVAIIEKSGYSKNFEGWDFPLRRIIVLPVGFGVAAGALILLLYLARALH